MNDFPVHIILNLYIKGTGRSTDITCTTISVYKQRWTIYKTNGKDILKKVILL